MLPHLHKCCLNKSAQKIPGIYLWCHIKTNIQADLVKPVVADPGLPGCYIWCDFASMKEYGVIIYMSSDETKSIISPIGRAKSHKGNRQKVIMKYKYIPNYSSKQIVHFTTEEIPWVNHRYTSCQLNIKLYILLI